MLFSVSWGKVTIPPITAASAYFSLIILNTKYLFERLRLFGLLRHGMYFWLRRRQLVPYDAFPVVRHALVNQSDYVGFVMLFKTIFNSRQKSCQSCWLIAFLSLFLYSSQSVNFDFIAVEKLYPQKISSPLLLILVLLILVLLSLKFSWVGVLKFSWGRGELKPQNF